MTEHELRLRSEEYSTFRAYREDAKMLAEIAELNGQTAAEAFRIICGEAIRAALVEATERRLNQLKAGA